MTLYRISFKLCSAIVTPLKGDTIWGHIVWGIANHEGGDAATKFLEQEKSNPPALVVSSAFPSGFVCRPVPDPIRKDDVLDINKYSEIKKKKKIKYVSASEYFTETEFKTPEMEEPFKNVQAMHNRIDRYTNSVIDKGLFSAEEKWPEVTDWDIYILSSYDKERVNQLVKWAFENGYGADASTGKGKIEIISDPVPVKAKKQSKDYMALGPFTAPKNGLEKLRADIFIRSGKLGGSFASGLSPYKKPVVLFDEGAVFESDEIQYVGELLQNMHGTKEYNICQSGFAPVIPV